MNKEKTSVIAIDLGAESGRVIAVHFDGVQLELEELHRFPNVPVSVRGIVHWDILRLWSELQKGIEKGKEFKPVSLGVDTWGVDFGLLDSQGNLLGNPVHYRDSRTNGMMEKVFEIVPREEVFAHTGCQFMQLNTLYQVMSLAEKNSPHLHQAETLLMMPNLINYWLTGVKACEYTIATTSQMLNGRTGKWAIDMLKQLDIPTHILPEIVQPGTKIGEVEGISVITPAGHDTGNAVACIPVSGDNFAYISSGTWSLIGLELEQPIITEDVLAANVTNEGGVYGTIRFLKNVTGLWIIQQCRAAWSSKGDDFGYEILINLAEQASPFTAFIDPDDSVFLTPGDHPALIQSICSWTNQPVPKSKGAIIRCVVESLALKYRYVLEQLINLTGKKVEVIHIVGGGTQNRLLCQMTADATGLRVLAGPIEATTIGNALVQFITSGELTNIAEARQVVARMEQIACYEPKETEIWDEVYERFVSINWNMVCGERHLL